VPGMLIIHDSNRLSLSAIQLEDEEEDVEE
jgi:hypothetical protein